MRKIYPKGETEQSDLKKLHPGFRLLRQDQELQLGFFSPSNIQAWLDRIVAFEKAHGITP